MFESGELVNCKCPEDAPQVAYCFDDLFCPHCGDRISGLWSEQQANNDSIYVFPTAGDPGESGDFFRFALTLKHADSNREIRQRAPLIDIERSTLEFDGVGNFFHTQLQVADAPGPRIRVTLKPVSEWTDKGTNWHTYLPIGGVSARMTLFGDFNDQTFDLRICRKPNLSINIEGSDALADTRGAITGSSLQFSIWRSDLLKLKMSLCSTTSPLVFVPFDTGREAVEIDPQGDENWIRIVKGVTEGEALPPGEGGMPVTLDLELDATNWTIASEESNHKLTLKVSTLPCITENIPELVFKREERGDISAWSSLPLTVGRMAPGESKRVYNTVCNYGAKAILLEQPKVSCEPINGNMDWLIVAWENATTTTEINLERNQERRLVLDIAIPKDIGDLPGEVLMATITIADHELQSRVWEKSVVIERVLQPEVYENPVAIDFGNTHTYAAIWDEEEASHVKPLLGGDPERYPTALCFTDLSDPRNPVYVVGNDAVEEGLRTPAALVQGLKRGISRHSQTQKRWVRDAAGNGHSYDDNELVGFFLQGVRRVCEQNMRKQARLIALSFPVMISNQQVAQLRTLLSLPLDSRESTPVLCEASLDEASAVILGFVLEQQQELVEPLLSDCRTSITIGSVDFGGGSLDTALMKLHYDGEGPLDFRMMRNEFLHFGGDANFGGDNVTVACMELLIDALVESLKQIEKPDASVPIVDPDTQDADGASIADVANFRALWALAEKIKIQLCTCHATKTSDADHQKFVAERILSLRDVVVQLADESRSPIMEMWNELESIMTARIARISLTLVYDHEIRRDRKGNSGYTVYGRVDECIENLQKAASKAASIDFLVLAGASSRLPLLRDRIKNRIENEFHGLHVSYDSNGAKSKVAAGLVRAMDRMENRKRITNFSPSIDYVRAPIGLYVKATRNFYPAIETCSKVWATSGEDAWHKLAGGFPSLWSGDGRTVTLEREISKSRYELAGAFDLSVAADLPEDQSVLESDEDPSVWGKVLPDTIEKMGHTVFIRMLGSENRIGLKVVVEREACKESFGIWFMTPPAG